MFNCLGIELEEETPQRFTKMMYDLTLYQNVPNEEIAESVKKIFEFDNSTNSKNMVVIKDIEEFSLCEHHIALMYDMKISVGYIPNKFVLGLSKIVRLTDMVCKRLQLQEKIAEDILQIMEILTQSRVIGGPNTAKHSRGTPRRRHEIGAETVTNNLSGIFLEDDALRDSFFSAIK